MSWRSCMYIQCPSSTAHRRFTLHFLSNDFVRAEATNETKPLRVDFLHTHLQTMTSRCWNVCPIITARMDRLLLILIVLKLVFYVKKEDTNYIDSTKK